MEIPPNVALYLKSPHCALTIAFRAKVTVATHGKRIMKTIKLAT